jgi:AraC family transcriptional regulator, exoenzyme S synthesis regulatory protein ExsA
VGFFHDHQQKLFKVDGCLLAAKVLYFKAGLAITYLTMIVDHRFFDFNGKRLIERLVVKTPFRYSAVFSNEACFLYVKEGQATLLAPTQRQTVATDEAIILRCGTYFSELMANKQSATCMVYAIHLYPDILKDIYHNEIPSFIKNETANWHVRHTGQKEVVAHFVESLSFYFDNPELVNPDLLRLKLQELVLLLLNTDSAVTLYDLFAHLFTPRKAQLADVVQAHLHSSLSVAEMAQLAGRSLSSFKREFSVVYNNTPASYIRDRRLEKAAELLVHTDLSVTEVCYRLGFNEAAHFSRLFKTKYQLSPIHYRKNAIQPKR